MSLPALLGFAGVLVAAVATGLLAGRAVRRPGIDSIVWTAATLALTVALAAQSVGFASGFGPATFRVIQLSALLLAPLWLAWGLAELTWPSESARFGARLACAALTVVGGVILATDPLAAQPFGKAWPPAGLHYQPPSHFVLDAGQAVAVILAAASVGAAAARARNDRARSGALPGTAAVGAAVLLPVLMRFSLPAWSLYPLLGLLAAALAGYGANRLDGPRRQLAREKTEPAEPADHGPIEVRPVTNGHRPPPAARDPLTGGPRASGDPGRVGESGPQPMAAPAAGPPGATAPPGPPARPYGRLQIFTLLEDRVADFDWLAGQMAEEVRTREPDTLVYVIHLVPNAPMQRIFYEIYRDRAAFDRHENQPYMKRFVADRRACVLATNVIELRLKYAKVAPLPGAQPPAQPWPRPQPPPGPPPPGPPLPAQPSAGRPYGGSDVGARITLLGRPGCHLCDDARATIERVAAEVGVGWEERDITASEDDMREYWDMIPVTLVDGVQIDFWRVSETRLRAALARQA